METLEMMAEAFRKASAENFKNKPRRRYPQQLREQAVEFATKSRTEGGQSVAVSARALGVSGWTLRYWLQKAGHEFGPGKRRVKPVVIHDEVLESGGLRLILRSGHEVHGLKLAELVQLIKAVG